MKSSAIGQYEKRSIAKKMIARSVARATTLGDV